VESTVGTYDDTVLKRLDDLMVNASKFGIKLLISCYSSNSLDSNDAYGKTYGQSGFYTNSDAISKFKNRLSHVLSHVNPHNNKAWKDCSEYIFAFEAINEGFAFDVRLLSGY
jgi:mannan endo-1,4-beta-mannosidase